MLFLTDHAFMRVRCGSGNVVGDVGLIWAKGGMICHHQETMVAAALRMHDSKYSCSDPVGLDPIRAAWLLPGLAYLYCAIVGLGFLSWLYV